MMQYANGQSNMAEDTTILITKNFNDMNLLSTRIITDDVQRDGVL